MSTPEAVAATEHVENLTRMLDSMRTFSGSEVREEGAAVQGADDGASEDAAPALSETTPAQNREVRLVKSKS